MLLSNSIQRIYFFREKDRVYRRERRKNPIVHLSRLKSERKWRNNNKVKMNLLRKSWKERNPKYHPLYFKEYYATHTGLRKVRNHARYLLKTFCCEICGSEKDLQKHYPDYSEPSFVVTLCKDCHLSVTNDDKQKRRLYANAQ